MTVALAAEAAAEGVEHAEAFYNGSEFWVLVAFVIVILAVGKKLFTMVTVALDKRTETISNQIEQATRLREEAHDLLSNYQHKQRDAIKEGESIIERARAEADRLAVEAAKDLEKALKRREAQAMERISQAEDKAMKDIRNMTVSLAIDASRRLLGENVTGEKADAMIDQAIRELPEKLG